MKFGKFTDERDGKTYKTVKIGNQVWMAENLNFDCPGSKVYDDDPANGEKYGRLYRWKTALKVAPKGFHLPTADEWQKLIDFVGGKEVAGTKLKSSSGWRGDVSLTVITHDGNGTDDYGFSALPGGYGAGRDFCHSGYCGYWWSATECDATDAHAASMDGLRGICAGVTLGQDPKREFYSVRCVRDE